MDRPTISRVSGMIATIRMMKVVDRVALTANPTVRFRRRRIEELMGIKAYNCFGMSEMNGPGVAFECQEQNGLHI